MRLSLLALVASLVLVESVVAVNLNWQKYATRTIAEIGSMKPRRSKADPFSTAFMFYVQAADRTMTPLFKDAKHKALTVVVPINTIFKTYIESFGGDVLDPDQQNTNEWVARWDDQFEYFFFKNATLLIDDLVAGETALFDTYKKSPAGDWPLQMAVRKSEDLFNVTLPVANVTYTATFYAAAGSAGNITLPDYEFANGYTSGHATDFWPIQPKSLSASMTALDNSAWADLSAKIDAVGALDSERDFTLFLPPSSAIDSAIKTLSSTELAAFLDAHLVRERVLLKNAEQTVGSLTVTNKWVSKGSINATVVQQDVLTSGGLVQVIDRSLYELKNETTSAGVRREEL